jgi:hypothetical protein
MLPDLTTFKSKMNRRLHALLKSEIDRRAPIVAQIRAVARHEGEGGSYQTEDGSIKKMDTKELSVPMELPVDSIPSLELDKTVEKIQALAQAMAEKKTALLFASISEAVEEVGNVIDAKGEKLTAELILKMWDSIVIAFDEKGHPQLPTLYLSPAQEQRAKEQLARIEAEPELRRRHQEIMDRQRLAWYDRESRRKLVD